jgi:DNA-3-methyladenine glycosylase
MRKKLGNDFYRRNDVLLIARELIGKVLVTHLDGIRTSGRIVECEAYAGVGDKAAHSFGGRRTSRTETMYSDGGVAYVYLCYGIHHLFNIVTNAKDTPQGILIRSLEPVKGIKDMLLRTGKESPDNSLTRGPGNVTKALGISTSHNAIPVTGTKIYVVDDGFRYPPASIQASPRIGVDYAGADALLPYRFYVKGNGFISGRPR